jgi:hypothetical protein
MSKNLIKKELTKILNESNDNAEKITYSAKADDSIAIDTATERSKTDGKDSTIELRTDEGEESEENVVYEIELSEDTDDRDADDLNGLVPDEEREERMANEQFEKIMEELNNSNCRTIKVNENINPRIKKADLVDYLKNKNNVKG